MDKNKMIDSLLSTIHALTVVDTKFRREQLSHGARFNLFKEMNLETDEVRLHSVFLSLLLDPGKSHGQKGRYLKPFIEMLNKRDSASMSMNVDDAIVEIEKYIGPKSGEKGGRIDIFIKDNNGNAVIIENKIYAGDQESQLKRYWNYCQDCIANGSIRQFKLVYLTLFGKEASDWSTGDLKEKDYLCISYKNDIIPWLSKCVELSACLPLIRETINQYIDVLRTLTYSDMENSNEVIKIMSQEQNLDAVFTIASNINAMIDNIINEILYPQLVAIANERGLELEFQKKSGWMTESYSGWSFKNPNWKYFKISVEFERKSLGSPIIGYHKKDDTIQRADVACWDELSNRVTNIAKNNQNWIYRILDKYQDWNTPETLKTIMDGKTMKSYLSDLLDEMISCSAGLDV